ncbi:hypothetical protein MKX08_004511 [Trichoderma sp. CBMAI-0020]|nr:hypothetical protein MKX08_004511 [Trichoderma sp. CBMAI-0020]
MTTNSETASRPSPRRRTPRRKSAKRHRETPSRSRNTTPRSSPNRYSASPKKTAYTPIKIRGDEDGHGTLVSNRTLADMQMAKRNYLGKLEWAKGEEQLFEILFLRQDIPLLPLHWEVDFRATTALTRLIDLTACVRTACQSGLRRKTPLMIKKALDKFIRWAAEDGGYSHLQHTPNVLVEILDKDAEQADLTSIIEARMNALARLHRKTLAIDQNITESMDIDRQVEMQIMSEAEASDEQQRQLLKQRRRPWGKLGSRIMSKLLGLIRFRPIIKPESRGETKVIDDEDEEQTTVCERKQTADRLSVKMEEDEKPGVKPESFEDDISMKDIPLAQTILSQSPLLPSPLPFRRPPPVIYGFFIISTTVCLFTVDSSKEGSSMNLSLHLDMNFHDQSQSVWNALTVAIVACLSRDDMMTRMDDFEEQRVFEESDVDA